ncbi:sulfite exporter TauE/SafE family protein [Reinekea marina]|uniref:Probable membrane transporter protein n=1 Tax=Reinekea marina TaxID=1310421 RepID=A0ABV7WMA0_9GAMM|nr:sulfite exporter TauE/SafE family protein [Reinekea marina]MDN3650697.1 sulfite exporter TauE/SafE family protein [Reinekea marina]
MELELTPLFISILAITGLISGVINTIAGGGSNLTLPALMMMGMPADAANATNRVGVFMQSLAAIQGFSAHGKMPTHDLKGIMIPLCIGGLVGSISASFMPVSFLKPVLLFTMLSLSAVILIRPSTVFPGPDETSKLVKGNVQAWWMLLFAGWYGGFVQAGVGFILIAAIGGTLRYDLVRTNALKVLAAGAFTLIALVVFIWRDQVMWVPGLILAASTVVGAKIGVKLSLNVDPKFMKWFLFVMTLAASAAAFL